MVYLDDIYLYVPRHSRITFVLKLDFSSGLGHDEFRSHGCGPRYLISDLGQFDFNGSDPECSMRLVSYHRGVSIERIQAKTGFEFEIAADLQETEPPTDEELFLLRNEIDPMRIRNLELLSGSQRRLLLREIIEQENIDLRSEL